MSDEKVTVFEIVERESGDIGIGNSVELSKQEAVALIKTGGAKHPDYPLDPETKIGGYPPEWDEEGAEEVGDERHFNQPGKRGRNQGGDLGD